MQQRTAIGLMSGTSCDGVDIALVETDGERLWHLGPIGYRAYTDEERALSPPARGRGLKLDTDARPARERPFQPGRYGLLPNLPWYCPDWTSTIAESCFPFMVRRRPTSSTGDGA